jgi:DNA (cytosine-5)-methyltransferase 1
MRQLDLFSGLGGFSLAASWFGIQTTQFVEIEPYCQSLLAKNFPGVPIHADITTYNPGLWEFDIITFGSPCQNISECNPNGRGLEGEQSRLFFEAMRIVRRVQPRFVLFENVRHILIRGFDRVLWEFAQIGIYDIEWQTISAASMGAPHLRERIFLIAHTKSTGAPRLSSPQTRPDFAPFSSSSFWQQNPPPQRTICALDDGLSRRLVRQRLKAIGNTVCPQAVAVAYQRIMELNNND